MVGDVLQEITPTPKENDALACLSRRRRRLVDERGRLSNALYVDLEAICPGLLEITREINNYWFLNFLTSRKGLTKHARIQHGRLLKIRGIGRKYADVIR